MYSSTTGDGMSGSAVPLDSWGMFMMCVWFEMTGICHEGTSQIWFTI